MASAQPILDQGPVLTDLPCVGCGYNLRTMPMDGRCPECGRDVAASAAAPGVRRASVRWLTSIRDGATWTTVGAILLCLAAAFTPTWMIALTGPAGARWSLIAVLILNDDVSTQDTPAYVLVGLGMILRLAALFPLVAIEGGRTSRTTPHLGRIEGVICLLSAFAAALAAGGDVLRAFAGLTLLFLIVFELFALMFFHARIQELAADVASRGAARLAAWGTIGHCAAPLTGLLSFIVLRRTVPWYAVAAVPASIGSLLLILALATIALTARRELARRAALATGDFPPETTRSGG